MQITKIKNAPILLLAMPFELTDHDFLVVAVEIGLN